MSIRNVPLLICDGCGTAIHSEFYLTLKPSGQRVIQQQPRRSPERHFDSEACAAWWWAQFPASGPWGPAWDERDWWCKHVGPCGERARVRTAHQENPLVDLEFHDADPEPIP